MTRWGDLPSYLKLFLGGLALLLSAVVLGAFVVSAATLVAVADGWVGAVPPTVLLFVELVVVACAATGRREPLVSLVGVGAVVVGVSVAGAGGDLSELAAWVAVVPPLVGVGATLLLGVLFVAVRRAVMRGVWA